MFGSENLQIATCETAVDEFIREAIQLEESGAAAGAGRAMRAVLGVA